MARRAQSGFTLLEVVVAFVVLALILSTAFQVFATGLARAGALEAQSQALALAQSQLATVGIEHEIKEGEVRGETKDRRYRWLVKTVPYEEPLPQPAPGSPPNAVVAPPQATYSLYRIDVVVQWDGTDGGVRDLRLATLQLGPRIPKP